MSTPPKIKTEPLYRLLREGRVEVFNQEIALGKSCDLTNCDFRGLDLRGREAFRAGRIPRKRFASASSPLAGTFF